MRDGNDGPQEFPVRWNLISRRPSDNAFAGEGFVPRQASG